jgi:purine-binding chemotaxis protein CheW
MKKPDFLIVFTLDDQRYALPLQAADRVVRMVAITPLPNAPDIILGIVDIQGRVIPVINLRRCFGLPERELALTDQLLVAHTTRRPVAVIADTVQDVIACSAQRLIETGSIVPGVEYVEGVVKLEDGLILIPNLEKFLTLEEENALSSVLESHVLENQALETA